MDDRKTMWRERGETPVPAFRKQGNPPFRVALVHGGPGALGSLAPLRRELSRDMGVVEAICAAPDLSAQLRELVRLLREEADPPAVLAGHSFGAMLGLLAAAQEPKLVSRLVLIGSGPLEEKDAAGIAAERLRRMEPAVREEYVALAGKLEDPGLDPESPEADALMARLGTIVMRADAWDPAPGALTPDPEAYPCRFSIMRSLWPAMRRLREAGGLVEAAGRISAPISVIHGGHDPHPAHGAAGPLARIHPGTRVFVLERCGHEPWLERGAREEFYRVLRGEIALGRDGG